MRTWKALAAAGVSVLAPLAMVAGAAQAATPVAVWHMEELGVMTDSSGNNNNGTPQGITGVADPGFGNGYHFVQGSIVTVRSSASLNPGTADISVTTRVRFDQPPSAATGDYDLIRKGLASTTGGEWKMEILPGGGYSSPAYCLFKDALGATAAVRGRSNLADGAWHTITCAKSSSQVSLQVDGGAPLVVAAALGSISNTQPVGLGQKPGGGDQYVGDMDEVRIEVGTTTTSTVDVTPPTVTAHTPAGTTGISRTANVTATFSEVVTNVTPLTFTLTPTSGGAAVPATVTFNSTSGRWVLNPGGTLLAKTSYTATVLGGAGGVRDLAGNPLAASATWSFTTGA